MRLPAFLILAACAVPTLAQTPPGRDVSRPDPTAMRARVADDLAVVLGLSAAQRPALDAFLAADGGRPPSPLPPSGAAPAGFERELAAMQARLDERTRADAAKIAAGRRFYAQLDARQKPVFDALMRLRRGAGGPGGHGGPGGPGGHGPGGRGPGGPKGPGGPDMPPR